MAEFPGKVSTNTSTQEAGSGGIRGFCAPDISFLRSIPGILMMVEIVLGIVVWALIAGTWYQLVAAYGWVMFVAVFCWIVTVILFIFLLFQLQKRVSFVPWGLAIFIYNVAATILYITGFIVCAAYVRTWAVTDYYNKCAAASFFACLVMIAYGASSFFTFLEWRGPGGSAASA